MTATSDREPPGVSVVLPPASPARMRLGALVEVILSSGYPTQLLLGVLLLQMGVPPYGPDGRLSMSYVVMLWLTDTGLTIGLITMFLRAHGERAGPMFLGLGVRRREVWLGLLAVPVLIGLVAGVLAAVRLLWPGLHNVAANPFAALIRTPRDAAILTGLAVLSGGIKEELQRAFILRRFERHLGGAFVGLLLFSMAFGAGHAIQGWDVGVATTLLGFIWGLMFLWRRSIVAASVSHAGFNVAQIIQYLVFGA